MFYWRIEVIERAGFYLHPTELIIECCPGEHIEYLLACNEPVFFLLEVWRVDALQQ
jgi:hypothetical protein